MRSPIRTAHFFSTCCLTGIAVAAGTSLAQLELPLASQPTPPSLTATLAPSPTALPTPPDPDQGDRGPFATAVLLSETSSLVPGSVAFIAVHFTIAPHWHTYWNGRSDTGFPFKAEWTLPPGFELAGPLQWPAPKRHISPGDILDHVYEESVAILVPIRVPESARAGDTVTIAADLTWLVCKSACVFEGDGVSLTLPIAAPGSAPAASGDTGTFAATRSRIPVPIEQAGALVSAKVIGSHLLIEAPGAERIEFYPLAKSVEMPSLLRDGAADAPRLKVALGEVADSEGKPRRVQGVVMIKMPGQKPGQMPGKAPSSTPGAQGSEPAAPSTAVLQSLIRYISVDLPMPGGNAPSK